MCFEENFKKCNGCGKILLVDAENFVRKSRSKDGFSTKCKKCDRADRQRKKVNWMNAFKSNLEKDFEYFVKNLPKLEAVEFGGIAKILGVALYKQIGVEDLSVEELKNMSDEDKYNLKLKLAIPIDEVFEQMMDRFLSLPRKRRKEINKILKDAQRGR